MGSAVGTRSASNQAEKEGEREKATSIHLSAPNQVVEEAKAPLSLQ